MVNDKGQEVVDITPSPDSLYVNHSESHGPIKCSEPNCAYVAPNPSMYGLHKAQVHKITTCAKKGVVHRYFCPAPGCSFHLESQTQRFFKAIDDLKTHYMKKHSDKKFDCKICGKKFGLKRDCLRHEKECGQTFTCLDCGKTYGNKSALNMHCNLKGHQKPVYSASKPTVKQKPSDKVDRKTGPVPSSKAQVTLILPKSLHAPNSMLVLADQNQILSPMPVGHQFVMSLVPNGAASNNADPGVLSVKPSQGVQTLCNLGTKTAGSQTHVHAVTLNAGIQTSESFTSVSRKQGCVAQTQTGVSILETAMAGANIPVVKHGTTQKWTRKSTKQRKKVTKQISLLATGTKLQRAGVTCQTSPLPILFGSSQGFGGDLVPSKESQYSFGKAHDILNTMSTQTHLSFPLDPNQPPKMTHYFQPITQDSQTQTLHDLVLGQKNSSPIDFLFQNPKQPQAADSFDQDMHTQTDRCNTDQDTQTFLADLFGAVDVQDIETQTNSDCTSNQRSHFSHDCQTQTNSFRHLSSKGFPRNDGQTQTSSAGIVDSQCFPSSDTHTQTNALPCHMEPEMLDQSTTCDEAFLFTAANLPTLPHIYGMKITASECTSLFSHQSCQRPELYTNNGFVDDLDLLLSEDKSTGPEMALASAPDTMNSNVTFASMSVTTHSDNGHGIQFQADCPMPGNSLLPGHPGMTQTGSNQLLPVLLTQSQGNTASQWEPPNSQRTQPVSTETMAPSFDDLVCLAETQTFLPPHVNPTQLVDMATDCSTQTSSPYPIDCMTQTGDEGCWDTGTQTMEDFASDMMTQTSADWLNLLMEGGDGSNSASTYTFPQPTKYVESAECQTYDSLFPELEFEPSDCNMEAPKYLESSHTQTNFDFDGTLSLPVGATGKESSETQTGFSAFVARETIECQTRLEDFLESMESSETQTQEVGFDLGTPSMDTHTQTSAVLEMLSNIDLIDSFTQTSLDQDTQTTWEDLKELF